MKMVQRRPLVVMMCNCSLVYLCRCVWFLLHKVAETKEKDGNVE